MHTRRMLDKKHAQVPGVHTHAGMLQLRSPVRMSDTIPGLMNIHGVVAAVTRAGAKRNSR
jgi:hypothetical protein